MRILKRVLLGLVILIAVLVAVAYVLPREVHVERSITIDAPPAAVFPHLKSLKTFKEWSPWTGKDPNAKYTFEGPDEGVGAKMTWVGDENVGSGAQEITASEENKLVRTALDFGDQGTATTEWQVEAVDGGTKVTWTLDSDMGMNPVGRWFGLFFDGMIGPDYEQGLKNLKARVETSAAPPAS